MRIRRCGTCKWFDGHPLGKYVECLAPVPDSVFVMNAGLERCSMKYCEGGGCPSWAERTDIIDDITLIEDAEEAGP